MGRGNKGPWYKDGLRFECTQCGECCSGPSGMVQFTTSEGSAMAKQLATTELDFFDNFASPCEEEDVWELKEVKTKFGYDCILLARDEESGKTWCTAHQARPTQCRTWPFWPDNLRHEKSWHYAGKGCEGIGRGDFVPLRVIQKELSETPEWSRTR